LELINHVRLKALLFSLLLFSNYSYSGELNLNGGVVTLVTLPTLFVEAEYKFSDQAIRVKYFEYLGVLGLSSHDYKGASFDYSFNQAEVNGVGNGFYVSTGKAEMSKHSILEEEYNYFGIGYELYEKDTDIKFIEKYFLRVQLDYYELVGGSRLSNEGNYNFVFPNIALGVGF